MQEAFRTTTVNMIKVKVSLQVPGHLAGIRIMLKQQQKVEKHLERKMR